MGSRLSAPRPFLSLRNATFRLGERLIFEKTSWNFQRDEHWAIQGPNGSGKSLLADCICGRLPIVQGELHYSFRSPPGLTTEQAIGRVAFEDRKLEAHQTVLQSRWNSIEEEAAPRVRDFLSYERVMEVNPFEVIGVHPKVLAGFERCRRRAVTVLRLEAFLDRTLLSLSNGEMQRVQLARALCHPLRLLILDEPFTGLDAAARKSFHQVLEHLMKGHLRVLLITTRMEDLPRPITHVLCVDECKVIVEGPRREILGGSNAGGRLVKTQFHPSRRTRIRQALRREKATTTTRRRELGSPSARQSRILAELRQVTVRYGSATILKNVNWTIREGESWALLGANGSGKTTLLSLLQGDNPQVYRNNVTLFGRKRGSGESIWQIKRRIGCVSPELHLHFNETSSCFEVVASGFDETVGLFIEPNSRQRAAADRWLRRFQLQEFDQVPLFALSAGQQRMVLLARALVKNPRLLLLDEPCQGLDAPHRQLFIGTLDSLLRAGTVTAIYVTHRMDEIPRSIQRILELNHGEAKECERC